MNKTIYFDKPAIKFDSGLPIGNGVIAAMVLGEADHTRFALNHEALWQCKGKERKVPVRRNRLQEVRNFIFNGEYKKATELAHDLYSHTNNEFGDKQHIQNYLPAGDIFVDINAGRVTDYCRSLDISTGIVNITYNGENTGKTQITAFISSAEGIGAVRIVTEKAVVPRIILSRTKDPDCRMVIKEGSDSITLKGIQDGILNFAIGLKIVKMSDYETVFYYNIDVALNSAEIDISIPNTDFEKLINSHIPVFKEKLGVADIELDATYTDATTDRRIEAMKQGKDDQLPILFFNFGKYLMVSGSGKLPHNLQGKWNEEISPPWASDYHLDINLQMNYWFTDVLGLWYANEALFAWCESCVGKGRERAKNLYGCKGICYNVSTDVWGSMTQDAYGWDVWISAAPWLAQHFYRHWLYTGDTEFLRNRAYPFIKECCLFIEDFVVEKDGTLCIAPSCSPENRFAEAGELPISVCADSAIDISLFREILWYASETAKVLGVDQGRWEKLLYNMPQLKIGSDGRLLEWDKQYTESEPEHRHISHLCGFYPGWLIKKGTSLEKACEKSLDVRLAAGGGQTGWSRSWVSCIYARLGRTEDAFQSIKNLISEQCSVSLLDFHPPTGRWKDPIFQIDGNFGGTAAICEMFVSVNYNDVTLLCACPSQWNNGRVNNFRLPFDTVISFSFKDGYVTQIELKSSVSHKLNLSIPGKTIVVDIISGQKKELRF